jgi:hypothetical protein
LSVALSVAFLGFYLAGTVLLVNAAHQGAQLVHAYGVRALVAADAASPPAASEGARTPHGDDDADD